VTLEHVEDLLVVLAGTMRERGVLRNGKLHVRQELVVGELLTRGVKAMEVSLSVGRKQGIDHLDVVPADTEEVATAEVVKDRDASHRLIGLVQPVHCEIDTAYGAA